jgi:predicted lactoylglutathione lyase
MNIPIASYARNGVVDAAAGTEVILVLGLETRDQVDQLADKAEAAGGSPVGTPRDDGYRYQRGFTDLDGHHWEALCLTDPGLTDPGLTDPGLTDPGLTDPAS